MTLLLTGLLFSQLVSAQTEQHKLSSTILTKDSLFWKAYNNCDTTQFQNFLTEDVEFYHDKGGLMLCMEDLSASFKKNLCSNENFRLRREAVAGR